MRAIMFAAALSFCGCGCPDACEPGLDAGSVPLVYQISCHARCAAGVQHTGTQVCASDPELELEVYTRDCESGHLADLMGCQATECECFIEPVVRDGSTVECEEE